MKTDQLAKALLKVGLKLVAPGFSDVAIAAAGEAGNLLIDARTQAAAAKVTERLLAGIEADLQSFAASEGVSQGDASMLLDLLRDVVERHSPRADDWVAAGFDVARLSEQTLERGKALWRDLPSGDRGLLHGLLKTYFAHLAQEQDVLRQLEGDFRGAVLGRLDGLPALLARASAAEAQRALSACAGVLLGLPRRPWRPGISPPGALLRADIEGPVPFHGRTDEIDSIDAWCDAPGALAVRLYTGAGGMGKSRLLIEACQRRAAAGWRSGFLDRRAAGMSTALSRALLDGAGRGGVLVVVDYAETRRAELQDLLSTAFTVCGAARVRIVLLARAAEDWWNQIKGGADGVADLLAGPATEWISLRPLASGIAEREASYCAALQHFASRLGTSCDMTPPDDLAAPCYDSALLLHMRALAGVQGVRVKGDQGILDYVLDRERRCWRDRARASGLPEPLLRGIGQAMAAITLGGGVRSPADALMLFDRIASLADQPRATLSAVSDLLHDTYPGDLWIEPIQPDLLGEHLVQAEMQDGSEALMNLVFGERSADGAP
jgi:hypothetical protein